MGLCRVFEMCSKGIARYQRDVYERDHGRFSVVTTPQSSSQSSAQRSPQPSPPALRVIGQPATIYRPDFSRLRPGATRPSHMVPEADAKGVVIDMRMARLKKAERLFTRDHL
jgi:hypothetical protein